MNTQNKIPQIHLLCGFMGFGKTTLAKRLALKLPAVRLTHDEFMKEAYGASPQSFEEKYKVIDALIWQKVSENILSGNSVILDYGFGIKQFV